MNRCVPLAVLVLLTIPAEIAVAQDTHYWNEQYGTRSTLLGGVVIGGVEDLGATFYNPGMVALRDKPEFLLSARVYQYGTITVEDGVSAGENLTTSSIRPAPSLVAGSFTFGWLGDHRLAYSVLTRQRIDVSLEANRGGRQDVIDTVPGDELYGAEFLGEQDMSDLWAGLTWAHPLGDNMGLGVTMYGALRSQSSRRQFVGEALTDSGDVAISVDIVDYQYDNYRLIWKFGWGIELSRVTLGLTFTTPSVNLGGSGQGLVNSAYSGVDLDGDGNVDPFLASSYQDGVSAVYKSPAAFGVGLRFPAGSFKIYVSGEYYASVAEYTALEIKPVRTLDGETIPAALQEALDDVFNWGVGLEWATKGRWTAYGSFATDYSAAVNDRVIEHDISSWDIYHVAGGGVISFSRSEITLGATYSFGDNDANLNFDLDNASEDTGLKGGDKRTKVDYSAFKLIFGFSVDI